MAKDKAQEHLGRNSKTICSHHNCQNIAIFSHAISNKFSISTIAENQHLMCFKPKRYQLIKNPQFHSMGVNDCTGFNGFCKEHDDLFQEIDNNVISTYRHIKLQVYRSLAYELHSEKVGFYNKMELSDDIIDNILSLFAKRKNKDLTSLEDKKIETIKRKLKDCFSERQNKSIENRVKVIEVLFDYFYKLIELNDEDDGKKVNRNEFTVISTDNMNYQIFYYLTDFNIPVSLNTKITLSGSDILNYYFIVVPYENESVIIGLVPDCSPDFINKKIQKSFDDKLSVVNFIESIISSCDGWFIKPSVLNDLSDDARTVFLNDCMFINERRFYQDYDLSLFNQLKSDITGNRVECFRRDVPEREDYETRYNNMMKVIEKSII
ncbi:TPA: hypothetical protein RQJ75_004426 [Vibrio vulnificus]|uniref:hypothetical protein n=1 Tax=Vibrio vulnificus TaxID=672 RepID=UPI001A23719C|nr:hypothetical protein [Vibrio vulnificus]MCA3979967.1 hypothetical protein [Vibrio vulnificus]MCA4006661.1 hypothetical protein [Vibrio vulnificus]HAS6377948.1 hypothetical protein [Vibrio vulnificus]HDY7653428.1 hypothetical protein [Vibrio vulnificus]HDY7850984.1 hypothetical protein [Vibrio vulnificus]